MNGSCSATCRRSPDGSPPAPARRSIERSHDRVDGRGTPAGGSADGSRCRRASARATGSRRSATDAGSAITNRDSEHIRSARIGFRLYAIADEPIWSASNGSSSSLPVRQQPQVGAALVRVSAIPRVRRAPAYRSCGNRSARDTAGLVEPERSATIRSSSLDLRVVAAEKLQKAGLRAGGPLHAEELQLVEAMLDLGEVEDQARSPQAGPLADGRELRRLKVGVAEAGQALPRRRTSPRASMAAARRGRRSPAPSRIRIRSVLSVT